MNEEKKLRPFENFEEDFVEYCTNRLGSDWKEDEEMVRDQIFHAFHILMMLNFRQTVGFLSNVDLYLCEFQEKFGGRYYQACGECEEKIQKGEITEKPNTGNRNGGCGGCS